MTAALADQLVFSDDQLRVLASRVGVFELPTALATRSRHATIEQREAAFRQAGRELLSRNLIDDDGIHPELASVLEALHRPDREMNVRLVTPEGIARVSIVRRGTLCALARRIGDSVSLRPMGHGVELRDVAATLHAELPTSRPADIGSFGAPLQEMTECLNGAHDPVELADRIRGLGAEAITAQLLGSAFGSRQAFAEVVYSVLNTNQDSIFRAPAAVAVYYSSRGRIVAAPSASPTGQLWITLRSGTPQCFTHAVRQLVDLAGRSWSIGGQDCT